MSKGQKKTASAKGEVVESNAMEEAGDSHEVAIEEVPEIYLLDIPNKTKVKRIHSNAYHNVEAEARAQGYSKEIVVIKARFAGKVATGAFREWLKANP